MSLNDVFISRCKQQLMSAVSPLNGGPALDTQRNKNGANSKLCNALRAGTVITQLNINSILVQNMQSIMTSSTYK